MMSGTSRNMNFWEVLYRLFFAKPGALGSVYVKYLKPIPVSKFLEENGYENL